MTEASKPVSRDYSQGKVADYKPFNFVDGEGVRCSLYVSGCLFHCPGCYNQATWDFGYGNDYTAELEAQIMTDLSQPYVQGLTLLGGEPFMNTGILLPLVQRIRRELPGKDIWSWTGYTWEELQTESQDKLDLLNAIDILVDGPFILTQKDLSLQFRGSANQRIIDVKKSLAAGHAVIWDKLNDGTQTVDAFHKEELI